MSAVIPCLKSKFNSRNFKWVTSILETFHSWTCTCPKVCATLYQGPAYGGKSLALPVGSGFFGTKLRAKNPEWNNAVSSIKVEPGAKWGQS